MFEFCCFLEGGVGAVEGIGLCFGSDKWDGGVGEGEVGSRGSRMSCQGYACLGIS